ncbi:MAG: hypothetical protein HY821_11855 [Acidobacteria bacterium]|nr:hypothetical protein [Acidobacteriota bacterium]
MFRLGAVLLAAGLLPAQQYDSKAPLTPDMILLGRIQYVVGLSLSKLPNFTCVETIERSQRVPGSKKHQLLDNVRLEVALVDGKELYAWPGARKFEDRDLTDMVGGGAIGTGDFALHAKSIYLSGNTKFTYLGLDQAAGRKAHKFHYSVSIDNSRYLMRYGGSEGFVGYQGDVWNDADTLEIIRIEMTIDDIPRQIPLKTGSKSIEYAPAEIGGATFVLPRSMDMTLEALNGGESRNRAVFTSCRQYTGESTLIFDEPPPDEKPKAAQVVLTLPAGLTVNLRLLKTIDLSKGAMGDLVEFEVTKDTAKGERVWLHKGTRVELRLDHIACRDFPSAHCFAAIAPGRFTDGNFTGAFSGEIIVPDLARAMELGLRNAPPQLRTIPFEIGQAAPGSAIIFIGGSRGRLASGYSTVWRTLESRGVTEP